MNMIRTSGGITTGIILLFILLIMICPVDANSGGHNYFGRNTGKGSYHSSRYSGKSSRDTFEEADSFFDRDGNEHLIDDDGYCEDCDDYHDWN